MKYNFLTPIILFLACFNIQAEDLDFGMWYDGIDSTSFTTLDLACRNAIDFYSFGRDKTIIFQDITTIDPFNFQCNFTEDNANKYRPVSIGLAGVSGGSGSNAKRFMPTSQDLTFDKTYKWIYNRATFGDNPFNVCKSRVLLYNESQSDHLIKYSHLEIYNNSGIPQSNEFQCIATKERLNHIGVVGFVSVGRIYTDETIINNNPVFYDYQCESEFCSTYNPEKPNSFDPDYGFQVPPVNHDLNSLGQILDDTLQSSKSINIDTSSISDDVSNIDSRIAQVLIDTSSIDSNIQELVNAKDGYQESLDIIANSLNTDIILALEDLGVEDDISNVITAIQESNTSTISKLNTISSLLADGANSNIDFTDLIDAINNTNASIDFTPLETAINQSSTNQAAATLASTNSIVDAIQNIDHSGSGSPDNSALEDLNNTIQDLDTSLQSSELDFPTDIDPATASLWDSSYPNGFEGVWSDKVESFKDTSLVNWLDSFSSSFNGQANTPAWSFCFDLGFINFGCNDLKVDDRVWSAIRVFLMLTAFFYSRRLVFGG
mgnify:CR=1 FL=1